MIHAPSDEPSFRSGFLLSHKSPLHVIEAGMAQDRPLCSICGRKRSKHHYQRSPNPSSIFKEDVCLRCIKAYHDTQSVRHVIALEIDCGCSRELGSNDGARRTCTRQVLLPELASESVLTEITELPSVQTVARYHSYETESREQKYRPYRTGHAEQSKLVAPPAVPLATKPYTIPS